MNLLRAMNCEYSRSKRWLLASLVLTAVFSLCSLVGSIGPIGLSKLLAVAAFLIQLSIVVCRRQSGAHYRLSEIVRRPAVLLAGLDRRPSETEIRRMVARLGISDSDNQIEAETYYASNASPGPQRLVEIIEESSFWTAELAQRTANFLDLGFKATLALFIVAMYAAIHTGLTTSYSDAAGKILLAFATFYFAGDMTDLKNKYCDLAEAAQRVTDQCAVVKAKPEPDLLREAMVLNDEYNCALAAAPVIPEIIHSRNQERLNSAWAAKCDPLSKIHT